MVCLGNRLICAPRDPARIGRDDGYVAERVASREAAEDAKAIVLPYDPDLERRERCNRAPTPTVKRAGRAVPPARAVAAIAGRHPVLLSA